MLTKSHVLSILIVIRSNLNFVSIAFKSLVLEAKIKHVGIFRLQNYFQSNTSIRNLNNSLNRMKHQLRKHILIIK
jgi:uracil phosphoribosyltransferase